MIRYFLVRYDEEHDNGLEYDRDAKTLHTLSHYDQVGNAVDELDDHAYRFIQFTLVKLSCHACT